MEQRHNMTCLSIYRGNVRTFFQIAANATQAKVIQIICPKVLPSDDVINLMGQN